MKETEEEKYNALRALIAQKNCPTIVYVSRTRRTIQLAEKLTSDGFPAKPFNGKMDSNEKITNQEAFINNQVKIIVATSAFGMGVDKKDVKLVIHYDISDSLENYVQEAGRAGRDPSLLAECYVLFNDNDLDKHFMLLNQTKLSISEIQQVWKALKDMTHEKPWVCCSALEIARQAGWDASVNEIETRVKTAVAALENAGYEDGEELCFEINDEHYRMVYHVHYEDGDDSLCGYYTQFGKKTDVKYVRISDVPEDGKYHPNASPSKIIAE